MFTVLPETLTFSLLQKMTDAKKGTISAPDGLHKTPNNPSEKWMTNALPIQKAKTNVTYVQVCRAATTSNLAGRTENWQPRRPMKSQNSDS